MYVSLHTSGLALAKPHCLGTKSEYIASVQCTLHAKLIIGPKDSGKSEGLKLIFKARKNTGHVVLDVDFKRSIMGSGWSIMPYVSSKFIILSSLKFESYKDLLEIIFTDCAIKAEESSLETLIKLVVTHYNTILANGINIRDFQKEKYPLNIEIIASKPVTADVMIGLSCLLSRVSFDTCNLVSQDYECSKSAIAKCSENCQEWCTV